MKKLDSKVGTFNWYCAGHLAHDGNTAAFPGRIFPLCLAFMLVEMTGLADKSCRLTKHFLFFL